MTLEEYIEWKKSGEKRKVRHADIVKMFIDKNKAEAVLCHVLLEEFNAKYEEEIHSNKAYIMTANSFPGVIKKILVNFPSWEKYINRNNEIARELFKFGKEKQKKPSLWGFNIWCFVLSTVCGTFGGIGGALRVSLYVAIWWFARKEYVKKITEPSSKANKFVIYLKWSLILVAISLGVGLPLRMWLSTLM